MQENFLRRVVIEWIQRASVGFTESEHFTNPESELRGFFWGIRFFVQDIPDPVEQGLRDQRFTLSARGQGPYVSRLNLFVLRVGGKARPFDREFSSVFLRRRGAKRVSPSGFFRAQLIRRRD